MQGGTLAGGPILRSQVFCAGGSGKVTSRTKLFSAVLTPADLHTLCPQESG